MKSLKGKRIVITRAVHQAGELADKIEALDGIVIHYPCIDIAQPDNLKPLDSALEHINEYDWLIVTSSNTVRIIAERLHDLKFSIDWEGIKVGAIGTKTNDTLKELLGIYADFMPENHTGSDLAYDLPIYPYQRVLLPQSSLADKDIHDILLGERQADVTVITAYKTIIGTGGDDVPQFLQNNLIDATTFTSPSTIENFVERIKPITAWDIPAFCIGSTTAKSAQDSGFQTVLFPDDHTIASLVELLVKHFDKVKHDPF